MLVSLLLSFSIFGSSFTFFSTGGGAPTTVLTRGILPAALDNPGGGDGVDPLLLKLFCNSFDTKMKQHHYHYQHHHLLHVEDDRHQRVLAAADAKA